MNFNKNSCDGVNKTLNIHFTNICDNKCEFCINNQYQNIDSKVPNIAKILNSIFQNQHKYEDVLFLGGEPCLYLKELLFCVMEIKNKTKLKVYITTSVPKICLDEKELFINLIKNVDGINLSVQHYIEEISDKIRNTKSKYNRQEFYKSLPYKNKIRININLSKPYLHNKNDILNCINYYDKLNFNSIKISEILNSENNFVSFQDIFDIRLGSAFYNGCNIEINKNKIKELSSIKTKLLLKRACFLCEKSINASFADGIKIFYKLIKNKPNNYGVLYENGYLTNKWI